MKKFILGLGLMVGLLWGSTWAQDLPTETQVGFAVLNISQDNQNAREVGARPGDVLRYELVLASTESIADYETRVNIAEIVQAAELIDTGLGEMTDNFLIFPKFSREGGWQQEFTFFARIKQDCGEVGQIRTSFGAKILTVPLQCELMKTGPTGFIIGIFLVIVLFGYLFFGRRRWTT